MMGEQSRVENAATGLLIRQEEDDVSAQMMKNAGTGWSVPAAQESGAISAPEPRVRLINREKPEHMGRENKLTQPASNPPSQTSHGHQPGAKWPQQRV